MSINRLAIALNQAYFLFPNTPGHLESITGTRKNYLHGGTLPSMVDDLNERAKHWTL